jgi:hypothetical protein
MYFLIVLDDSADASETGQSTEVIYMRYDRQVCYHQWIVFMESMKETTTGKDLYEWFSTTVERYNVME